MTAETMLRLASGAETPRRVIGVGSRLAVAYGPGSGVAERLAEMWGSVGTPVGVTGWVGSSADARESAAGRSLRDRLTFVRLSRWHRYGGAL